MYRLQRLVIYQFILIQLIHVHIGIAIDISSPTSGNATHSYFITSEHNDQTNYFKDSSITCTTPYCHMICDMIRSCQRVIVHASAPTTDTLVIECTHDAACENAKIYAATVTNVNLICDTGTKFIYGTGTCRNLRLNASHSSFVDIFVDKRSADSSLSNAYSADLHLNNAGTVTVTALHTHSLQYAKIYADNVLHSLTLSCTGAYACQSTEVHATYVSSNVSVSIDCTASGKAYACKDARFYCPHDAGCSIICPYDAACNGAEIYISDVDYTGLDLQCSPSGSYLPCTDTTIHCETYESRYPPDSFSTLMYHPYAWHCGGGCCPSDAFPQGLIDCTPGASCSIDCDDGISCRNKLINGTAATSLWVECKGTTCDSATILCPIGNGTSCRIDCLGNYYNTEPGPCKYATIERRSGDNVMSSFNLNCYGSESNNDYPSYCYSVYVDLNADLIDNFAVHCEGYQACHAMVFNLSHIASVTDFSWMCTFTEACMDVNLDVNVGSIANLWLKCAGQYSCQYTSWSVSSAIVNAFNFWCIAKGCNVMSMDVSSPVIPSLVWNCTDAYACAGTNFTASGPQVGALSVLCPVEFACNAINLNAYTNDLSMQCVGCKGMDVYAQVSNSATITCLDVDSCHGADVHVVSTAPDVNFHFECQNPEVTGLYDEGSCYQSKWNIYGYVDATNNDAITNDLSMSCGGDSSGKGDWDCNQMEFHAFDINNLQMSCKDYVGCKDVILGVSTVQKVDLECTAQSACAGVQIYCPYKEKNACNITCIGEYIDKWDNLRGSCGGLDVHVADDYTYDYLNLYCPSDSQTSACSGIVANCETQRPAVYVWDDDILNWRCNNSVNEEYCCPYFDGTSVSPTESPSAIPTDLPSLSPVKEPSVTPSVSPTLQPTTDTVLPSNIPTEQPSSGTVSPTGVPTNAPVTSAPVSAPSGAPGGSSEETTSLVIDSKANVEWKNVIVTTVAIIACVYFA